MSNTKKVLIQYGMVRRRYPCSTNEWKTSKSEEKPTSNAQKFYSYKSNWFCTQCF